MLKTHLILVSALIFSSHQAFAQEEALITKTNVTGYVPPEYARTETCEVFANEVVITNTYGYSENGFVTQEVRPITLSDSIQNVLADAATETLESTDNYLCDGPSTSVSSYYSGEKTVLFETGGCSSPRLERKGGASHLLMSLVLSYCPVVHDFADAS